MVKNVLLLFLLILVSCKKEPSNDLPIQRGARIISFAGYKWAVESSNEKAIGPGPNYFSDSEENVWIDKQGKLHLKIIQRNGKYYCAKISLWKSFGYHKYAFFIGNRIDELDTNAVVGLFAYKNDEQEIDVEISKWGVAQNDNCQFSIQPSYIHGNKIRFNLNLEKDSSSSYFFDWQKDKIDFGAFLGHNMDPPETKIVNKWTYQGENIPRLPGLKIKINLWLFKGKIPQDTVENELIITDFKILQNEKSPINITCLGIGENE